MNRNKYDKIIEGIFHQDRASLARAITILESTAEHDKEAAFYILKNIANPNSSKKNKSFRIGISGVPGVGKSTFIESFGLFAIEQGHKVAVLAIDPSSSVTGGSILGDKTRMAFLASHDDAFIRPTPTSGALGGVANATYESILLCEAAGYDFIIIETVGVGQSETEVSMLTDFFLLLMLSNAGDELQGVKRGIMELCDALYINKADGDNLIKAKTAATEYASALELIPYKSHQIPRFTGTCSALTKTGLIELWERIIAFKNNISDSGFLDKNRNAQQQYFLVKYTLLMIANYAKKSNSFQEKKSEWLHKIESGEISILEASNTFAKEYLDV